MSKKEFIPRFIFFTQAVSFVSSSNQFLFLANAHGAHSPEEILEVLNVKRLYRGLVQIYFRFLLPFHSFFFFSPLKYRFLVQERSKRGTVLSNMTICKVHFGTA